MDTFDGRQFPPDGGQPVEEAPSESPERTASAENDIPAEHGETAARDSAPRQKEKTSPYAGSPYETGSWSDPEPFVYQPQTQPPEKVEKPPRSPKGGRKVSFFLLTAAMVAAGCLITAACVNSAWEERAENQASALNRQIEDLQNQIDALAESTAPAGTASLTDGAMTPSQVYRSCADSVVAISASVTTDNYFGASDGSSSGSGFLLSEDGYIVTNYHVVEGAYEVEVTLYNEQAYPAQVIGGDSTNDLAILKIEASGLPAARIGSSGSLSIGDMVVAIGNPLGELSSTQTVGYVSGIEREITTSSTILSMIQTDAAINPGNSGGPLFNMNGEVVGITTAKYSGTTESGASIEGIGFAIPIDDVMDSISDLVDYGYVTGAYLGITVTDTDEYSAELFNLPTGAYVVSVEDGYCAQKAGIQEKDIIIALGDTTVGNRVDLVRALRGFQAGDQTTVTVIRSGQQLTMDITLDERPKDLDQIVQETQPEYGPSVPGSGEWEDWEEFFDWFG